MIVRPGRLALLLLAGLVLWTGLSPAAQQIPLLQTAHGTYSNVVITSSSGDHVIARHSGGLATIRTEDLPSEVQQQLGLRPKAREAVTVTVPTPEARSAAPANAPQKSRDANTEAGRLERLGQHWQAFREGFISSFTPGAPAQKSAATGSGVIMGIMGAGGIAFYVWYALLLWKLCHAANGNGSLLVFLPVIRWIPLFQAANMHGQCVLGWIFVLVAIVCPPPIHSATGFLIYLCVVGVLLAVALVLNAIWSFRICTAFNRSRWLGPFVLFPLTTPLTLYYLASAGVKEESAG